MNWTTKINLNGAIAKANEEYDLTRAEEPVPPPVAEMLCAELKKAAPLRRHVKPLKECKSIAALNRLLDKVFDDADRERVWCGFS